MIDKYTLRKQIVVNASQEKAFRAFTERFDTWWPRAHHIGDADLKRAVMEPGVGGRWYEIGVDGSECEWGHVVAWEPPNHLRLTWQLTSDWKYDPDFVTYVDVTFTPDGAGSTLVVLEHRNLNQYGEDYEKMLAGFNAGGGWAGLLAMFATEAQAG